MKRLFAIALTLSLGGLAACGDGNNPQHDGGPGSDTSINSSGTSTDTSAGINSGGGSITDTTGRDSTLHNADSMRRNN